jgi:hypothetical protein
MKFIKKNNKEYMKPFEKKENKNGKKKKHASSIYKKKNLINN